ncbi:MAG TPA: ArdC family protein [Mycobacteriales bacterium]|nr:ArdC family protein [Mycobacteriales bacterium]
MPAAHSGLGVSEVGREDRLAAIHAQLQEQVERLSGSEQWRTMLSVAARFHSYSPNNVLLIAAQRPEATRVAGYRAWAQLGRQVRKGEHGIAILAPMLRRHDPVDTTTPNRDGHEPSPEGGGARRVLAGFRVTHVFDIAQTDGPDLPDLHPVLLEGASPLGLWSDLYDQVEAAGYEIDYADLGQANGITDFANRKVLLHSARSGAQLTKTVAHELAHIDLHAPDVRPDGMTRDRAEVEAESVAYVVTAAHGLSTEDYSVPYVTGWAGGNTELLAQTATRVLATARLILHAAPPPKLGADLPVALDRSLTPTLGRPATEAQRPVGQGMSR